MDPFSIALLAGSTALSGIGALGEKAAQNKFQAQNYQADLQQMQQDQQAAAIRNAVLADYRNRIRGFADTNQGDFNAGIAAFAPIGQRLDTATADRGNTISTAMGGATNVGAIPLRAGAPSTVSNAYSSGLGDAFTRAQGQAGALAGVGGYGDFMSAGARDISGVGEKVKTTNQLARGVAELLPYEQDLASFKVYSPINRPAAPDVPWWATLAKGAGKLGGAYAGTKF